MSRRHELLKRADPETNPFASKLIEPSEKPSSQPVETQQHCEFSLV